MNFGDVEVQSAGEVVHFKFRQVASPQNVKDVISKAMKEYKQAHFKSEAIEMAREMEKARDEVEVDKVVVPENLPQ
jgi:hypothetical protein